MILRVMTGIKQILLTAIIGLCFVDCVTEQPNGISDIPDEQLEIFLPQPRFSDPKPRLLNRVLIEWLEIEGTDGYEIQISSAESFHSVKKIWIVKGTHLEIPIPQDGTVWLRIRAFNADVTSEWSTVLAIREIV